MDNAKTIKEYFGAKRQSYQAIFWLIRTIACGIVSLENELEFQLSEEINMTDERKTPEIEEADFITLEFDDGEVECEIMGVFEFEGKEYIALIPNDETDDVYIYGYKEVGDEEFELVDIEDDAEFEKVVAEFDKIMEEA
jgi:hypothetical protein